MTKAAVREPTAVRQQHVDVGMPAQKLARRLHEADRTDRPVNGRYWVFYGALSDVEYWVTVTDTETGKRRVYHNPPGEFCGRASTKAF